MCTKLANKFQNEEGRELVLNEGFTYPAKVWASSGRDVSRLASADHEEADTIILLHAKKVSEQGYPQTFVVSQDTDVSHRFEEDIASGIPCCNRPVCWHWKALRMGYLPKQF